MSERGSERGREGLSECACVWEDGGRKEAGGRKEGADTALKTKTPHVNAGNKDNPAVSGHEDSERLLEGRRCSWT